MSKIEVQELNNNSVDVFKNDIDMYIHLWMDERNIPDMCKVSQNRWYNCCKYIYENVFKLNPKYLKDDNNINNAYDTEKGWNGKGMWLCIIPHTNNMWKGFPMQDCIGMKTADDKMQPGWLASQADMLAEDWIVVE